ncbi:tetratricopeptide repeat protein [Streptomyces sp. NPDC002285]
MTPNPISMLAELSMTRSAEARDLHTLGEDPLAFVKVRECAELCYRYAGATQVSPAGVESMLYDLTVHLADLGQADDAVVAVHEIAGRLCEMPDHRYGTRPLRHLGVALDALLEYVDALAASRRAEAREEIADPATPHRVASLDAESARLSDAGEAREALAAAERAARTSRRLCDLDRGTWLPELVKSLTQLADRLDALGRGEDAMVTLREAYVTCRELELAHPGGYRSWVAAALHAYVQRVDDLGLTYTAVTVVQDAVRLWRELTAANAANTPTLIHWLARWRDLLDDVRALEVERERLALIRRLVASDAELNDHSGRHLPLLAQSLAELGMLLCREASRNTAADMEAAAIDALRESADVRIRLCRGEPAELIALAETLEALLERVVGVDELSQDACMQDLATVYRRLTGLDPDTWLGKLASTLADFHDFLGALDAPPADRARAAAVGEEAVRAYRQLGPSDEQQWRLAWTLNDLASDLRWAGRRTEALAAINEAVQLRRDLAEREPGRRWSVSGDSRADVALSLQDQADDLAALARYDEAIAVAEEAVSTWRRVVGDADNTGRWSLELAESLHRLAGHLRTADRPAHARAAVAEAAAGRRHHADQHPNWHRGPLVESLRDLVHDLGTLGRDEEAREVAAELEGA